MKFATATLACALAAAPALAQQSVYANPSAVKAPRPSRAMRVVIDAGHGGVDKGLVGAGLPEKEATLQLALELRSELEKRGAQVVLTRASDKFMPLKERVDVASDVSADCFLSLHKMETRKPSPYFGLFYFSPQSKALASALSPAIGNGFGSQAARAKVEIRQQRFYVLRQAAPAVLVDVDWQGMSDPSVQTPLVKALAEGTMKFLQSARK